MSRDQQIASGNRTATIWLIVFAVISALCYIFIGTLSMAFRTDVPVGRSVPCDERPLLAVLAIFAVAFACYFGSIVLAVRIRPSRALVAILWVGAVFFRLVMLPSPPIQEIDLYRYIWDGEVTMAGVSPYRYPPTVVLNAVAVADRGTPTTDEQLEVLVHHVQNDPHLKTVLETIGFGDLPTVYPVVSQAVFAAVALATPTGATPMARCVVMKTAVVLFDLATFATVLYLLSLIGKPIGWAVVYGWCPLVIKEFANSGHLDSIATFLTILTLAIAVRMIVKSSHLAPRDDAEPGERQPIRSGTPWLSVLALALVGSAAIGAKLFPVVLVPLLGALIVRHFGWIPAVVAGVVVCILVGGMLWPMVGPELTDDQGTAAGLRAFLSRWEMNDFLFMLILENLRPQEHVRPADRPWFDVVPDDISRPIVEASSRLFVADKVRSPFFLTRTLTGLAFLIIALGLVWNLDRRIDADTGGVSHAEQWLRAAFLTIAWFWLLAPTQNPWYWCWAMPLAAFARSRTWLVMSAIVMAYYLRFWLQCHFADQTVLGTSYHGGNFFHFVVVWFEYFPWYVALAVETWWRKDK